MTTWCGGRHCDLCGAEISKEKWFVDGKTKMGSWALLCPACFKKEGVGLGTGKGQMYDGLTLKKIGG